MSEKQLHKRFTDEQVKLIIAKYESGQITGRQAMKYLEIGHTRFYQLISDYEQNTKDFSIDYSRRKPNRKLDLNIEKNILKELKTEKEKIIDNPDVPTRTYNYSYIKNLLEEKYDQKASLPTIIARAKENGYWKKKPKKKIHDREVITNYVGELFQHDSSHHLFAPDGNIKWYLITSLDDYSRKLLYADLFLKETTWTHIMALQSVFLNYGLPLSYYSDQHSIFRYVKDRDKDDRWNIYTKFTDDVDTQWKQVLNDCRVKPIYALSPQAKGKIERPYGWLQDHLVRTCVREGITRIEEGKEILKQEIIAYNSKRVHSTTGEIPDMRFYRALKEKKSLLKEFKIIPPFKSAKDIFCLRIKRTVDSYRNISIKNCVLKVPGVLPRHEVEARMHPDFETGIVEVRFWSEEELKGMQKLKIEDLHGVHF